jgi:translation initiation factor IF-3
VLSLQQALDIARQKGLDLIEVAPQGDPPVCRIVDWGKFRYEQQKKSREAQKKSRQVEIKHLRVRPNTDDHDIDYKLRNARRFLEKGNKVKFNVIFRGPELRHREIGERQLARFVEGLTDIATVSQFPHMEGRQMILILEPKPEIYAKLAEARKQAKRSEGAAAAGEEQEPRGDRGVMEEALAGAEDMDDDLEDEDDGELEDDDLEAEGEIVGSMEDDEE